jgi:hypothetical protein
MIVTIQLKRGSKANLPASAADGEPVFCMDTGEFFVWNGSSFVNPNLSFKGSVAALPNTPTKNDVVLLTEGATTLFAIYDGSNWKKQTINIDVDAILASIALKADKTYVDTQLATKAEQQVIEDEITRAMRAEETLLIKSDNISGAIATETSRATGKEDAISGAIVSEITRATGVENTLSTSIVTESNRAAAAETANANAISTEKTRAEQSETQLLGFISALDADTVRQVNDAFPLSGRLIFTGADIVTSPTDPTKMDVAFSQRALISKTPQYYDPPNNDYSIEIPWTNSSEDFELGMAYNSNNIIYPDFLALGQATVVLPANQVCTPIVMKLGDSQVTTRVRSKGRLNLYDGDENPVGYENVSHQVRYLDDDFDGGTY